MKDIGRIFILIGIVILCFILQIYAFNLITFWGVKANIMLTLCVVLAIWLKPSISIPFNFVIGIISDLIFTFSIGKYLIVYLVLSICIIALSIFYNKENRGTTVIIIIFATILAEYIFGIYNFIKFGTMANVFNITFVGIKGAVLNIIIGIILGKILKSMTKKYI